MSSDAQMATVYADGTTSGDVYFQMQAKPVYANVNVYYVNAADNSVLLTDTKTDLAAGEHWISPDRAGEISGYDLVSSDAQLVTVYADGTISGDVYFQMQAVAAPDPEMSEIINRNGTNTFDATDTAVTVAYQ